MRTITVTEKYRAVNEGKMAKSEFVRQMRQSYPMYVSSVSDFNSTVQILKNQNMLFEEKTEVDDSFKYSTDSLRRAIDIELEAAGLMSHEKVSGEDQEKARVKAVANLKKDPLHYYHLISGDSSKVDKHDKTVEVKKGNEVDTFNGLKKAELKENLKEGTRALVGYLSGDRLTTTYNHYDGYPSGLGQGLMTHYNNDDLAKDIAMKGYITSMDPASGEISATHSDPAKKITLDDDAEERAREIAGEIDGMGADYGYIWDDESNQWITIKNTGIRSMIDQMMDKLSMMNVYSGDKMNEAEPTLKETLGGIVAFLKSKGAKNDSIKDFIKTHKDDIQGMSMDDVEDEYNNFLSVNTDYVDEKKVKEDFAPSPNSDLMDANAEEFDIATAFKKARVDMSKPVTILHAYGSSAFGGDDKYEMSAEAAIKMLEAERQERRKTYTDDGKEVPSDWHSYEFENTSVLEEDMPEGHEYKLAYFQTGDNDYAITQEKSGVSEKKVVEGDIPFYNSSKKHERFEDIADYPVQHAFKKAGVDMGKPVMVTDVQIQGYDEDVNNDEMDTTGAASYYEEERKKHIAQALKDYGKEWDDLSKTSPGVMPEYSFDEAGFDETPDGHDFKLVIQYSEGSYVIISQKSEVSEKKGKDHDGDGDIDKDDYMAAKDKAIKKAMGKDEAIRESLKAIITKVLEEKQINEAATNVLAAFGDDYAGFEGMKSAINQLENIVTDIEQYYDKTRTKIQKIYDTLGEIRNEEGLKVGGFLAPAVEQAFNRDLRPVIKMGFTKGLDQPQVKKLASPGMAQETEAPKETVFTPVQEHKKK